MSGFLVSASGEENPLYRSEEGRSKGDSPLAHEIGDKFECRRSLAIAAISCADWRPDDRRRGEPRKCRSAIWHSPERLTENSFEYLIQSFVPGVDSLDDLLRVAAPLRKIE
jgi:hypothetical protein